jgi:hypothetical protein
MSRTQLLYDLQQVDLEIETVARRLKKIAAQLGESPELRQARKAVADAEARLSKSRAQMHNLELEVNGLLQKIEANEERLYSGRVGNPKELANLQDEVASLKRWRAKKEEDLLEAMLATEEAEASLAEAQSIMAQVSENWRAAQGDLGDEQARLEARLQELREQRANLTAAAGPEDVAAYERLRRSKGGRAVAAVVNGICQGCRMNPPSSQVQHARQGIDLVFCNNCGRILHVTT